MSTWNETKKKRSVRSLTFTLTLAFLTMSVMMIMITSFVFVYFSLQTQEELIAEQQQLIAQNAADKVNGFIQYKIGILSATSSVGKFTGNQDDQKTTLEKTLGTESSFRQLFLLDEQGQELVSVSRLSSTMSGIVYESVSKDAMLSQVGLGETYIGSVYIDELTSEPMVIMAVPVKDVFGDFKGILAAEVNLKLMWDLVSRLEIGRKGLAYVVDKDGKLLAFSDISRVLKGESLLHLSEVGEFIKGDEEYHVSSAEVSSGINGNQVVANHAHLGDPDWAVVVELPVEEAFEHVNLEIILSASTIILSIFMALLVALYLSRKITGPIINLRDAAIEIGKGNLDTKIEVNMKDEIGELAQAFRQMTIELKKSKKSFEDYNKNLENIVKERTNELDRKVSELTETKTAVLNMMEDMDIANKELITTQDQLKKSLNELKETDVKKDQFISIAAHELKTPLTSIHGFSQLLQNRKVANNINNRNKYLKIMDHETKRLARLVTDILDLSRIDLNTIKLCTEEVDLNNLIETVKSEMEIPTKEKGLGFEHDIERKLPKIITDPERLTQILINLLNNSIKYTEKGKIKLSVHSDSKNVHFSVKDTGIGISKDDQEKIFERFYQVDSSYTRKAGGTGLGLALTKEFVTIMDGKLWVKSEEGKGSEFGFNLPVKRKAKVHMRAAVKTARKNLKDSEKTGKKIKEMGFSSGDSS